MTVGLPGVGGTPGGHNPIPMREQATRVRKGRSRLTPAEAEVVAMLGRGLKPKQIAELRGTSILTVRTQIKRAKKKLGAKTLAELPKLAQ